MRMSCTQKDCYVAEDGICQMGEPNVDACKFGGAMIQDGDETKVDVAHQDIVQFDQIRPPWTGRAFSGSDVAPLVGYTRPLLVGLLGSSDAGKTTYLMTTYLCLHQGHPLDTYRFAASYTLGGWENLADYGRFQPGQPPRFPPHTSSGLERTPGLLHLALRHDRSEDETLTAVHVLLADAPGEWFDQWSISADGNAAEGARWIARHADGMMLFMDCDALAGNQRGAAATKLIRLIDRLGSRVAGRPVATIWSKADRRSAIPASVHSRVDDALSRNLPARREFSVRAGNPDPSPKAGAPEGDIASSMSWLFDQIRRQATTPFASPPPISADPFFAYRGYTAEEAE